MTQTRKLIITLAALAVPALLLAAPTVDWFTVDGGGSKSTGGNFELTGTIGQPDASAASAMAGGNLSLTGGFWSVTLPACSNFAPADFNQDCFVDVQDLAIFQACTSGPVVLYDAQNLPPGCVLAPDGSGHIAADFDADGAVDQRDFGVFQRCYSGPGTVADPNCAN
jgi:hypothetical protein